MGTGQCARLPRNYRAWFPQLLRAVRAEHQPWSRREPDIPQRVLPSVHPQSPGPAGVSEIECRREVFEAYNAEIDDRHSRMIWTRPGITNWYRNSSGRVVTNSPFTLLEYWQMTRTPSMDDFVVQGP